MKERHLLLRAIGFVGRALLFAVIALCGAIIIVPPFLDRIYYEGPRSAHFDGQRFFNPDGEDSLSVPGKGGRGTMLVRYLLRTDGRPDWPAQVAVTPSRPAARIDGDRMVATWIGHASVLVQTQGLNILTDPIWADNTGPLGIGPTRVAAPGVRFYDLPKIDLILVSHNHYDHMDIATLKRLWDRDKPLIVTSLGNDALLTAAGIAHRYATTDCGACGGVEALDWGGRTTLIKDDKAFAHVIVTRNHHWGSRWFADRRRALWSSFVVTLPGGNLFFAGDTGFGDGQWPVDARGYGPIRLALLPIGAFRFTPGQMDIGSHMGPIQSAEVFARLGAAHAIGIHWGTFRLSYEAYDTPPKLLAAVMQCRAMNGFATMAIGKPVDIAPYAARHAAARTMQQCRDDPHYAGFR
jgi:L-ascorbate metabolism protein UlaG (beta-lactamase superfamily)